MNKITAVVLTKNEEKNVKDCLDTLNFCDEIIVIDDSSNDNTVNIAEEYGAKVYNRKLDSDYAAQRNFALEKTESEWVLFVDADERVTKELGLEIQKSVRDNNYNGYFIKRNDYFLGKPLKGGEAYGMKLLRLGKKNKGKWKRNVHEVWDIQEPVGELRYSLEHYAHKDLTEFIGKFNYYSTLHAGENLKEGKTSNILKILLYPVLKFKLNFIIKKGYLDGTRGFVHAVLMSMHSFLAWSKLWMLQKKQV